MSKLTLDEALKIISESGVKTLRLVEKVMTPEQRAAKIDHDFDFWIGMPVDEYLTKLEEALKKTKLGKSTGAQLISFDEGFNPAAKYNNVRYTLRCTPEGVKKATYGPGDVIIDAQIEYLLEKREAVIIARASLVGKDSSIKVLDEIKSREEFDDNIKVEIDYAEEYLNKFMNSMKGASDMSAGRFNWGVVRDVIDDQHLYWLMPPDRPGISCYLQIGDPYPLALWTADGTLLRMNAEDEWKTKTFRFDKIDVYWDEDHVHEIFKDKVEETSKKLARARSSKGIGELLADL